MATRFTSNTVCIAVPFSGWCIFTTVYHKNSLILLAFHPFGGNPWHCTLQPPLATELRLLQARAAPRCLCCGLFVCPSVRPSSVRCRLVCSPLPRWVLGAPVSWICVVWLALRCQPRAPPARVPRRRLSYLGRAGGLEAQGRPVSPRLVLFSVCLICLVCDVCCDCCFLLYVLVLFLFIFL